MFDQVSPPTEIGPEAPLQVRLGHETTLHADILSKLVEMIDDGLAHTGQRHEEWRRVDEANRLYVDIDRSARAGDKTTIEGKKEMPFHRSFMIPVSYANVMARMAMRYSQVTARDPIIHLEGGDTGDVAGARLHEAIMRWDYNQSQGALALWQLLFDEDRYGFALCHDTWEEDYGYRYEKPLYAPEIKNALPPHLRELAEERKVWGVRTQWQNWQPIDPYGAIIDGSSSMWNPARWRFCGHRSRENWLFLKERERQANGSGGPYFNVTEARRQALTAREDESKRDTNGSFSGDIDSAYPDLWLYHLQCKIIPREWKLSPETRPEKWTFAVSDKKVIVRAHRSVYRHDSFTYSTSVADLDMHAPFSAGTAEQLDGIQRLVNYFVFANVTNARRALNDSLIYDPSLLNEKDISQPGPMHHIRMTKLGQKMLHRGMLGIDRMYGQLRISDVTSQHMQTVGQMMDFAQLLSGASSVAQGQLFPSKRTLGEVEKAVSGSNLLVGVSTQLFDRMMIGSLARKGVANRQQFTSMAQAVRISGDLAAKMGRERLMVRPNDLRGNYDYVPRTPTDSVDPSRMASIWGTMIEIIARAPQLLAPTNGKRLDPHAIFNEFVQASGVKYLDKFYVEDVKVVPDEIMARHVQSGRAAPVSGPMGQVG